MENRNNNSSIRQKLQVAKDAATADYEKKAEAWKTNPYVKGTMYLAGALFVVWASQFAFAAVEGAIRQFKKLRRTIKES